MRNESRFIRFFRDDRDDNGGLIPAGDSQWFDEDIGRRRKQKDGSTRRGITGDTGFSAVNERLS